MRGFTPPGLRDGFVSTLIYGLVSFYFSPLVAMMTMGPWAWLCNIICSIYEVFYHVRANTMSPNQIEMYGQYTTHIVRINSHFMPMGSIYFHIVKSLSSTVINHDIKNRILTAISETATIRFSIASHEINVSSPQKGIPVAKRNVTEMFV